MQTEPKERPVIFNGEMIRAVLADDKTQTRRVMRVQPSDFVPSPNVHKTRRKSAYFDAYNNGPHWCWWTPDNRQGPDWIRCPYGVPGDRLWVRETHGLVWPGEQPPADSTDCTVEYRADLRPGCTDRPGGWPLSDSPDPICPKWRPSIFMPRWASRILLEVVSVRVERVQDISEADAKAEGCKGWECRVLHGGVDCGVVDWQTSKEEFQRLWDSINGKRPGCSWDEGPWVWVVEFRRLNADAG